MERAALLGASVIFSCGLNEFLTWVFQIWKIDHIGEAFPGPE